MCLLIRCTHLAGKDLTREVDETQPGYAAQLKSPGFPPLTSIDDVSEKMVILPILHAENCKIYRGPQATPRLISKTSKTQSQLASSIHLVRRSIPRNSSARTGSAPLGNSVRSEAELGLYML
jgi:hypothetical protein